MTNLGALTCFCYVLNVVFWELTSAQYLALIHLIHKVNTHFFLQSAECLQLCGHAVSQRAKNRTSASEVVMGTQLTKHFESIISFSFFLLLFGKLRIKGPHCSFIVFWVLVFSGCHYLFNDTQW